ncbi:hypothetical protein Syun_018930 [Stephania yunnanensis]|uniref:Uncharacterized protein n=1 Tax=Stephania yunnanensis TaxID=152371 RepID=A0AAP0NW90_9MAGN
MKVTIKGKVGKKREEKVSGEQSDEESGDEGEEEAEEEEYEELVVGKMAVAKGGSKAKPGTPKGKKPIDDPPHHSLEGLKTRCC